MTQKTISIILLTNLYPPTPWNSQKGDQLRKTFLLEMSRISLKGKKKQNPPTYMNISHWVSRHWAAPLTIITYEPLHHQIVVNQPYHSYR